MKILNFSQPYVELLSKMCTRFMKKSKSKLNKKQMTLKLFEILEQFVSDTFLIALTQFEKT